MAIPFWMLQKLGATNPLGGTGGFAGGGAYPPPWSTPPFNPNAPMNGGRPTPVPLPGSLPGPRPGGSGGFNPNYVGAGGPPPQAAPPRGPKWLQAISGGFNKFANGMAGVQNNPNLTPQENAAMAQQQRMAMTAALLQGAAPRPQGTGSPLADFGSAMFAGQQAGGQFAADAMRAKLMQAQMAQAQQGAQDPSTIREMQALGYPLTPEGFKEYNAAQARPGTTINIGDEMNKPIPIAQLDTVRLPDGTTPPIGTTFGQARDMGAKVLSAEDQKRTIQADQALGILNQLEEMAIGPDGVFNEVAPGLANRAASAIDFGLNMLTQNDPRASQFHDMSQATLAPFIKFLGETGSLAQGDVQRAIGLLPRIFPLPDTGEVARDKIAELREIITRGVTKMNSVSRQSEDMPPPPPGFTLDR
jgi:hypothetical protein